MEISMIIELLDETNLPENFKYPTSLLKIITLGLVDVEPWYFLNKEQAIIRLNGLKERYPSRILIPFARRCDNDDIACFEPSKPDSVQIIHDFASPGWEQRKVYDDFWSWFRDAIEEMIDFS